MLEGNQARLALLTVRRRRAADHDRTRALPDEFVIKVVSALTVAWTQLLADGEAEGADIRTMDEESISDRLDDLLNDLRKTRSLAGFDSDAFQTIVREGLVVDETGRRYKLKPDFCFRLRAHTHEEGLFVECKILGAGRTVADYCKEGIARFVDGLYARAVDNGLMVAYAWDEVTVDAHLLPHLDASRGGTADAFQTVDLPAPMDGWEPSLRRSKHKRNQGLPPIALVHMWLRPV